MAAERTAADYAIEHGEYLAQAVESYVTAQNAHDALLHAEETDSERLSRSAEVVCDLWLAMRNCVYEFRKRAERAKKGGPPHTLSRAETHQ